MLAQPEEQWLLCVKQLLNKLNIQNNLACCFFFFPPLAKNLNLDQKVNQKNDKCLCTDPLMALNFPPPVMFFFEVVSNGGYVIPSHFFQQGFRLNAAVFTEVLET